MRIALVYNQRKSSNSSTGDGADDRYAEWDSEETIQAIARALARRHDVSLVEADEDCFEKLRRNRPELVFNISEGLNGSSREAQVPAMLELLEIPYTGSDPLTLSVCLEKSRAKEILSYHKVPNPAFQVVETADQPVRVKLPCLVKPLYEGSSKGIFNDSLVRTRSELASAVRRIVDKYSEPALVEQFLPGREFTVALLGNGDEVRILPIVEVRFDTLPPGVNPIYSYEAKWVWDTTDKPLEIFECPANLSSELEERVRETCLRAYRVLRCRDWCRIDVRLDAKGNPHVIELNPLPGIIPDPAANSCFPKAARSAGLDYDDLILAVTDAAIARVGLAKDASRAAATQPSPSPRWPPAPPIA
ncbi:MAG: ATP-grasp domain-containing protein [Candidatus Wallbacteria bacterium]|nr:ATP-grasp domain-containing protein [Candidatus Wallbacteria bacterium]